MTNNEELQLLSEMVGTAPTPIQGVCTGLRLEKGGKRVSYTTFEDKIGCLTRDQISKVLAAPGRTTARVEFDSDWVLNQGQRSSCAGYAAGGMMEKQYKRQYGKRVKLGPEYIYAKANGGRDSGAVLRRVIEVAFEGCAIREMVPYQSYLKRDHGPEAQMSAKRFRLAEGEIVGIHSDDELASALALNWLVLLACDVTDNWFKLDANGVVLPCLNGPGNHAIHADDVRINAKGEYEYDHQGSWGLSYGQKGRAWISWAKHLKNTTKHHEFVAIRAMYPDPDADTLPLPK
jgi:hypothetical protein